MKALDNLSIRAKLVAGFGAIIACLVAVGAMAFGAISVVQGSQERLFRVEFPLTVELIKLRNSLQRDRILINRAILTSVPEKTEGYVDELREVDQEIGERVQALSQLEQISGSLGADFHAIVAILEDYRKTRNAESIPLLRAQRMDEARALTLGVQLARYQRMIDLSQRISRISETSQAAQTKRTEGVARNALLLIVLLGTAAILISLGAIVYLVKSIALPVTRLSDLVERVAYGDLTVVVSESGREDEIGKLQFTLAMMVASLRQITQELRNVSMVLAGELATPSSPARETKLRELATRLEKLMGEYRI